MSEQPKKITVNGPEGYSSEASYYDPSGIRAVLQRFDGYLAECISKDDQEAAQGAETAQCPDRSAFTSQADGVKNGARAALDSIWQTFHSQVEPKAQVVPTLVDTMAKQWGMVGVDLDGIQGHVHKHINEDEWKSKGAQEYKQALPTQSKALFELEELCYRADTVCTSAAAINGAVFTTIYESCRTVEHPVKAASEKAVANLQYWSGSSASKDSNGCVSFLYYQRTSTAKANFEGLRDWLNQFITTRGEWSGSAQMVADDIPSTMGSVQNLMPGGQWPKPLAQVTAEGNVDDQSSSSADQYHGAGARDGDGVDLNNEGWIFG